MKIKSTNAGFTLVEILIVVAILSILAAAAIPKYRFFLTKSMRTECLVTLEAVRVAQSSYFSETNSYAVGNPGPVHQKLGLDFDVTLKSGYAFTTVYSGNTPSCRGFQVRVTKNIDKDPTLDTFRLFTDCASTGEPGKSGTPHLFLDDLVL